MYKVKVHTTYVTGFGDKCQGVRGHPGHPVDAATGACYCNVWAHHDTCRQTLTNTAYMSACGHHVSARGLSSPRPCPAPSTSQPSPVQLSSH